MKRNKFFNRLGLLLCYAGWMVGLGMAKGAGEATQATRQPGNEFGAAITDSATEVPTFTVSGRVTSNGVPFAGVVIKVTTLAPEHWPVTDTNGHYAITLLSDTYTLIPNSSPFGFLPGSRFITLNQDLTNVDFAAGTVITMTRQTNGVVRLAVYGQSRTNRIEASTDLKTWESIFTNRTAPFLFFDHQATNIANRFYRVVEMR